MTLHEQLNDIFGFLPLEQVNAIERIIVKARKEELELLNNQMVVIPNHESKEMYRAVKMSYIEDRIKALGKELA